MPSPPARQPWWKYVPTGKRSITAMEVRRLRFINLLHARRFWLFVSITLYIIGAIVLLYTYAPGLAALALAPVALLPVLGYVVYWLIWKEFHE
ncbi:MAG: hypothetical protein VKJ66_08520 [Synechococcus sp.]|nr:hypothetical protein [Synechococcus sp.]